MVTRKEGKTATKCHVPKVYRGSGEQVAVSCSSAQYARPSTQRTGGGFSWEAFGSLPLEVAPVPESQRTSSCGQAQVFAV